MEITATKKRQGDRSLYERLGETLPQSALWRGYHHAKRVALIVEMVKTIGGDGLLLDAGCGDGQLIRRLQGSTTSIGIDLSYTRLVRASNNARRAQFLVADVYALPFSEEMFNCVVLSQVLEHLKYPVEALGEVARVLRKGGHLLLDFPSKSNLVDQALKALGKEPTWGLNIDCSHVAFYDLPTVKSLLASCKFDLVSVEALCPLRYDLPLIRRCTWKRSRWWIHASLDWLFKTIPPTKRMGAIQLVLAQKR
ncbi:MAG: class I SAM-dependent methyltransferase [Chloroflexota bacterium]